MAQSYTSELTAGGRRLKRRLRLRRMMDVFLGKWGREILAAADVKLNIF